MNGVPYATASEMKPYIFRSRQFPNAIAKCSGTEKRVQCAPRKCSCRQFVSRLHQIHRFDRSLFVEFFILFPSCHQCATESGQRSEATDNCQEHTGYKFPLKTQQSEISGKKLKIHFYVPRIRYLRSSSSVLNGSSAFVMLWTSSILFIHHSWNANGFLFGNAIPCAVNSDHSIKRCYVI